MVFLTDRYRHAVRWAIECRWLTIGAGLAGLCVALYLTFGPVIGAEFLPHLDEGAIWVRGTLADSTNLTEGVRFTNQTRLILASFPEVTKVVSEVGRPDDGTDTGGFGNTEYFVDLKSKEQWRPVFSQDKDELIAAMNRELEKRPGSTWNFSQNIWQRAKLEERPVTNNRHYETERFGLLKEPAVNRLNPNEPELGVEPPVRSSVNKLTCPLAKSLLMASGFTPGGANSSSDKSILQSEPC
jgi:multidrug efflux pump subunit AcrB